MLKTVCAALALLAAAPAFAQPPAPAPAAAQAAAPLTVDSPLRDLVLNPKTRPVIEKHMPGFAARLESEQMTAEMFAGISLAGLEHDPHVQGMTPAAITKIGAELAEAQKPS